MTSQRDTNSKWTAGMVISILLLLIGFGVTTASENFEDESPDLMIQCKLRGEDLPGLNSENSEIEIKSFPFLASYGYENENKTWIHICTATIISKTELLTSAHCLRLLEQI